MIYENDLFEIEFLDFRFVLSVKIVHEAHTQTS